MKTRCGWKAFVVCLCGLIVTGAPLACKAAGEPPAGLLPPLVGRGWVNGWIQSWEQPPSGLEVRDAYEPLAPGFTRVTRRWTWRGKTPLEQVTLAVRIHVGGARLKPFIPGILMYGNPSNAGRTDGRVPVYAGAPGEFAIFEDHRLPMPFVLLEDANARNFTAVHTVPSPVRGAKREDLWWSAGVEKSVGDGADIVLLSGPVGYNRRHSVVKALQRGAMAYDETYITLMPDQVVEKIFYVQHGTATDAAFGFQQALAKTLELYPPANMPIYADVRAIAKAKRDYAMTRWIDKNGMSGFNMYGSQQNYRAFTMGWCGCAATCGWALPVLNFDPADVVKAQKSLDFLADTMGPHLRPDGLFPVTFNPDTKRLSGGDPVSCGQALLSFMRAIRHAAKDTRLNATKWRTFADKAAGAMAEVVLKSDWKTPQSTAIGFYVAPLVLAAETFQKPAYRAAAEKIATHLAKTYIGYERVYWGGTLDASCEDKEGAYAAFQGFAALLFDAVRRGDKAAEAVWAPRARHALDLTLTYTMVWDATYPAGRLSDHAFKSTGWTVVSAQNQHLDAFGVLMTPEISRMGRYLKDPRLERLAQVMYASCFQLTSPDGSLGEQIQHTNFAQQGAMNDVRKLRGGYSEHWVVFWLTAHFLNAAASFECPEDSM